MSFDSFPAQQERVSRHAGDIFFEDILGLEEGFGDTVTRFKDRFILLKDYFAQEDVDPRALATYNFLTDQKNRTNPEYQQAVELMKAYAKQFASR